MGAATGFDSNNARGFKRRMAGEELSVFSDVEVLDQRGRSERKLVGSDVS